MAHPKWKLVDRKRPFQSVEGELVKAYLYDLDGDLNFQIRPAPAYEFLLRTVEDHIPYELLECEVETLDRYEDKVLEAFLPFVGQQVTAYGVWVIDTPHGNKAELHPLDVLMARMLGDQVPKWTEQFCVAYPGSSVYVHVVFAGADQSDKKQPHFNDVTRTTHVNLPFPPKPAPSQNGQWYPAFELDIKIREHTMYSCSIKWKEAEPIFEFAVTPRSQVEGEPGLILLDVVTYWRPAEKD